MTLNSLGRWVSCIPAAAVDSQGTKLTQRIIEHAHKLLGHLGRSRTLEYNFYWWPRMATQVEAFCGTCDAYQKSKPNNSKPHGLLHSLPVPYRPWESIGIDFVGPLVEVDGFNFLMVVIDRLTSVVHLIPTSTKVTASGVAQLFMDYVVKYHGLPDSIVSD